MSSVAELQKLLVRDGLLRHDGGAPRPVGTTARRQPIPSLAKSEPDRKSRIQNQALKMPARQAQSNRVATNDTRRECRPVGNGIPTTVRPASAGSWVIGGSIARASPTEAQVRERAAHMPTGWRVNSLLEVKNAELAMGHAGLQVHFVVRRTLHSHSTLASPSQTGPLIKRRRGLISSRQKL
jgi:hypothetical protein